MAFYINLWGAFASGSSLSESEYLRLPEDKIGIAEGGLLIAKGIRPNINIEKYLNIIDSYAEELKLQLKSDMTPKQVVSIRKGVFLTPLSKHNVLAHLISNRGYVFDNREDYRKALLDYNTSIVLCPKNPMAYNNRGAIRAILGQNEKALVDFSKALSLNPNYAKAYCGRGTLVINKGEYSRALVDINKALELDPYQADAHNSFGIAMLHQRQYASAVKAFTRAAELKDKYNEAYFNRALANSLLGIKQDMLADLGKTIELNPELKQNALLNMGFTMWREDVGFKALTALTPRTDMGTASSLKEFPLLYLYFNEFKEIGAAEQSGQLMVAIHASDRRSKNYSVKNVLNNEKIFLSLYDDNLLRVRLNDGVTLCRSAEKLYWDMITTPEKYTDELESDDEFSRNLQKEINKSVNAIRKRYGL